MSSQQQEKERRRQERLAREQAAARSAARRKRMQLAVGALLALALAGGVAALVLAGGGGSDDDGGNARQATAPAGVTLPTQETGDLQAAAKAAGCKVAHPEIEGNAQHIPDKQFKASDYNTNPPSSGAHNPNWYEDGIYEPGNVPQLGMLVHTLEHGRINVQYKPGTPKQTVAQLEALLAEQSNGYHMLLYENTTGMKAAVAASTWGHLLTCPTMNDKVFDALRTFRASYIDKGPENVP